MYASFRHVPVSKGIATLLTLALALWAVGVHMFTEAEAANLTYVKDTLSDSAPSSLSNHEIQFLSPGLISGGQTITVTFPSGFTGTSSVTLTDLDFEINGTDETLAAGAPGAAEWGFTWSGQTLTLTAGGSESLATSATATIKIGSNADGGTMRLINPSATTSYEITITAGPTHTGQTRVAIIENVLVTANVDTILTFNVYGTTTSATVNGSPTTTSTTTTNTTLPFGTLSPGTSKTLAQDLTVATNARNGYIVTVVQDQQLLSSTGADIDGFVDGNWTTTPTAWSGPTGNVSQENTWGHWGLTSTDYVTGRTNEFSSDTWIAASTTPVIIMGHTGPSDATTAGIGRATIGYQAQITTLQEAGDDYNTTLTYVATPTF